MDHPKLPGYNTQSRFSLAIAASVGMLVVLSHLFDGGLTQNDLVAGVLIFGCLAGVVPTRWALVSRALIGIALLLALAYLVQLSRG